MLRFLNQESDGKFPGVQQLQPFSTYIRLIFVLSFPFQPAQLPASHNFTDSFNSSSVRAQIIIFAPSLELNLALACPIPLPAPVITATNHNLRDMVAHKRFREDLFFRLNIITITLPPLRERMVDIPQLIEHFSGRIIEKLKKTMKDISKEAREYLMNYD